MFLNVPLDMVHGSILQWGNNICFRSVQNIFPSVVCETTHNVVLLLRNRQKPKNKRYLSTDDKAHLFIRLTCVDSAKKVIR